MTQLEGHYHEEITGDPAYKRGDFREIDLDLIHLLARFATTPIKWDIISLFAANPNVRDTASGIAGRLARPINPVHRELEDLVLLGLLQHRGTPAGVVYYLTDSPELLLALSHFDAAQRAGRERQRSRPIPKTQ